MKSDNSTEAFLQNTPPQKYDEEIEQDDSLTKSSPMNVKTDQSSQLNKGTGDPQYTLYPFRWIIQIFFTLAFLTSGLILCGFAPIADPISKFFGCPVVIVQAQTLLFLICYIPGNFLVIWVLDKLGLRACIMIGSCLLIVGAWLRQFIQVSDNFYLCFPGTILCAFGQVFFINCQSKFASTWFGDRERALSTAMCSLSMPIGSIIGFVMPALMVTNDGTGDKVEGRSEFYRYLLVQNIVITLGALPILIIVKEKPPTPPSKSAEKQDNEQLQFKKELKQLMKNPSYLLLAITFTCLYGIYTSLGAVVSSITKPYGYTSTDNSIFGGLFIFFGVGGSFVIGMLLDRYQKFKLTVILLSVFACVFIAFAYLTLQSRNVALFSINLIFVGFTVIPIIPCSYAFAVELTYPVAESMSNGMLILPSQIFGTVLGIAASKLCDSSPLYAVTLFLCSAIIGAIASFFIKEDLRRLKPKINASQITDGEKSLTIPVVDGQIQSYSTSYGNNHSSI